MKSILKCKQFFVCVDDERENRLSSAMKSGEASMAEYNNKNGIFKRNSPMSELVVVENERTNEQN